nr:MAG TPA: hypothetical protein [Caudoviricetes sp.]
MQIKKTPTAATVRVRCECNHFRMEERLHLSIDYIFFCPLVQ